MNGFQQTGNAFQGFAGGLYAFQQSDSGQVVPYPKPAGRAKKRRYEVEIDGQIFPVDSPAHARALLEQARELALRQAPEVAETIVAQRLHSKAPQGKPIRVPVPQISTPDDELANIVIQARHAIARIYREQALAAEIRLRIQLQSKQQDDDDDEFLLLL